MTKSKSLASLTPTLLARKGSAKPAMRPQFQPIQETAARQIDDDLGFNDMGHDEALGEVVELKSAVAEHHAAKPEVLRLQEHIAGRIGRDTRRGKPSKRLAGDS